MNVFSSLSFITSHPLNRKHKVKAVLRFLKWQLGTRFNKYPVVYPFTERARLIVQKGMVGATGNLYCGLHEFHDMSFLIHLLRPDDFFCDIGANVGSYTVLASAHVGSTTFSFEPIPATFSTLQQNISLNGIASKVTAYNVALGSAKGKIGFKMNSFNVMNHVAQKGETVDMEVPVEKLDDILIDQPVPILLKIDVEGFETEVIKGAMKTLAATGLKAIIIEFNGSGAQYGYDEKEIHESLLKLNFEVFQYDPETRILSVLENFGNYNTIYVRDFDFVQARLKSAEKIRILDQYI